MKRYAERANIPAANAASAPLVTSAWLSPKKPCWSTTPTVGRASATSPTAAGMVTRASERSPSDMRARNISTVAMHPGPGEVRPERRHDRHGQQPDRHLEQHERRLVRRHAARAGLGQHGHRVEGHLIGGDVRRRSSPTAARPGRRRDGASPGFHAQVHAGAAQGGQEHERRDDDSRRRAEGEHEPERRVGCASRCPAACASQLRQGDERHDHDDVVDDRRPRRGEEPTPGVSASPRRAR